MAHSFAGYRVVHPLSTGPRSIVERAVRAADGRTVVIKQPAGELVAVEAARRVQYEYGLLHALRGDGVVEVCEVIRDGSHVALVTESFGDGLAAWIADRRLSLDDALDLGIKLARIVGRIHAAGVVHKDINPNNIVYDPTSRTVKLIDFDIASRTRSAGLELVAPAALEGTLHYIAPEQTGRLNRAVDARSDLYSLGITLYELFTGARPFHGDDALALVHAHLAVQPKRLDELDPAIPGMVADIVMKLIAKAPEQRYQTADGLRADLERCQHELETTGQIAAFAVGQHDVSNRFEFSARLYGREPEVAALFEAFRRAASGAVETVLISGYAGIGKSSVVRELYAPVTIRRGYVASGKFEQLHRDVPYSGVVAALEELLAQIVADPALERWRSEIAAAVAGDAPLVRSVLPAIERVLGPQPPPPALDPETARRRLAVALSRLVWVFARTEHPLVLFLDDMQWADAASLQLITQIATSEGTESLLLIEAYRDNEVDPSHPFAHALRDLEKRGARLSRIALAPLGLADTADLVADALRVSPGEVGAAASMIWRKTEGNPFFIREFTQALYDDGYIAFDPLANAFAFDLAAIERAAITENVADLLARKLGKLPAATRDALVTAAAIGNRFDVATLAIVTGRSAAAVHESLAPAVDAGLILPLAQLVRIAPDFAGGGRYAFQHDRIQQAAYEASPADARTRLHLEIGTQLLSSANPDELDARLFDIVHHLNRGLALITDDAELARFVELALVAARRARRAGAFDVAITLLTSACASRDLGEHYPVWFACHLELAEVLSLAGQHPSAREVVRSTSPHATPRDRATLEALDTTACLSLGLMREAVACTRRAAALLGVDLPADPEELGRGIQAEIGAIMAAAEATPIEDWIDLPAMNDPDQLVVMALLTNCAPAAYQSEPALMALLSAKLVVLSLRHGNCGASARAYAGFAIVLWMMGQYDLGFRFGKLGVDLVRHLDARADVPGVDFIFATFASPWRRPLEDSVERLRAIVAGSIEVFDVANAGFAAAFTIAFRHFRGDPLREVIDEARSFRKLCVRLGVAQLAAWLSWYLRHARKWTGALPEPGETELDTAAVEQTLLAASGSESMLVMCRILELEQVFWCGDFKDVMERSRAIAPALGSLPANVISVTFRFCNCLASIAVGDTGSEFEAVRTDLARYAAACPANFAHMSWLVEAELARTRGDVANAMALYDTAIASAADNGFIKVETIGHELAAQFWLERGKPEFAVVHLGKARDLCEHLGASPRAYELEKRRRELGALGGGHPTASATTGVAGTLDFATLVKAGHAIASDIVLDSLLAKLMEIIIEYTGAQTGSIILASNGELCVHASKQVGSSVSVTGGLPLARAHDASEGIIKYVTRTSAQVVLADAARDPTFRTDPYVRERRPRSVLCLPIVHKDQMIGAVYLENNLVAGAFTVERLEALGVLIAQLAISIENAMMFSRLEDVVAQRTRALSEANQQLREQAVVRERMESELRLAQKLQAVGQLAAGVAHEINTPMQYFGDNIAFLQDGVVALLALVGVYRASIDTATGAIDAAAIRGAEHDADVDYLRSNALEAAECAHDGLARMSKIVRALKTFSDPDPPEQAPTQLNTALENTLTVAYNAYHDVADIELDLGDIPAVRCHVGEVSQVLLNLVVNAAHAIEDTVKHTACRGTISITSRFAGDSVVIAIRDTGGGIPDAIRERVFDPYFTTKMVGRGSGQGLTLARTAIVDRHGGSIDFVTALGVGTTFFVRLPVHGRAMAAIAR